MTNVSYPSFFIEFWFYLLNIWEVCEFWVYDGFIYYPCVGDCSYTYNYNYKDYMMTRQIPSIYILTTMVKTDKLTSMGELL